MYISKWHQTEQESERGAQALHTRTWCVKWDAKSSGRIDFASWSTGKRCDASLIAFACSVAPSIYRSFSLAQLEHPHQIDSFSSVRFWATHTQILHAVTKPQAKPYSRANGYLPPSCGIIDGVHIPTNRILSLSTTLFPSALGWNRWCILALNYTQATLPYPFTSQHSLSLLVEVEGDK